MSDNNPNNKKMINLLRLNSVGCILDSESGMVYPQLELPNGDVMPDINMGTSLVDDEVSAEWYGELSSEDYDKVKSYI